MQIYFYFYTAITIIALLVHLVINWHELLGKRDVRQRTWEIEYRRYLICLTIFFVIDILWGVFGGLQWMKLLVLDTSFFFVAMAAMVCARTRYVIAYLDIDDKLGRYLLGTGHMLMLFVVVSLIVNSFTGICFYLNAENEYVAGPLRHLIYALMILFDIFGSILMLSKLMQTSGAVRRRFTMVLAFCIITTIAIAIQFGDAFLPLYSTGCLLGCCVLHVFVIEDERDEMHRKEMLAHDYQAKLEYERAASKAKSLFFSTVSHDIRTPLNAILGFSELLEQGESDEEVCRRYISSIRSSGKVLARLVDDILDLSKLESGKLELIEEPTDIPALVREVVSSGEVARSRKSLAMKSEIGEIPWVSVDPQRVRQLLYNLLSNAYKYTAKGTITVRAGWNDGTLTLAVSDTGEGISEENIARILQPFVQVVDKNHRDGTGLGLSICQRLAALMGGEMTISSKVGVGSTFTITLHNVKTVDAPVGKKSAAKRFSQTQSRILVVDDSSVNRAVLKAMLGKCGVSDIVMAENGRVALERLREDPDFDLVLTDLWMPEMDGNGLVRAIREDEKLSHIPVYLLTADVEARNVANAQDFTGVLLKPVTMEKLQELFE